jgi:glycosyltransferase involved in cell wall biosynthesis
LRVAFLSPLPPAPTGIADYAADVLALLADHHEIDVFHAQASVDRSRLPGRCEVRPVSEFEPLYHAKPHDVVVYQMGNGPGHTFLYDHLSRIPGLLCLHDLVLHHSRAAQFLEAEAVRAWRRDPASIAAREAARPWLESWRAELAYSYPEAGDRLFAALLGTVGDLLPYAYPLFRVPVEASRLIAVHNHFMAGAVRDEVPGAEVVVLPQPASRVPVEREEVAALRRRLGFADDAPVVAAFGLLTPEKRIETVARAVARAAVWAPGLRLLLAGPVPDVPRLAAQLDRLGVAPRTVVTGRLPLEALPVHMEAADIVVHLRYPTARETSAALLRVLAQGRATIVSDLEHQAGLPADAVVRVDVTREEAEVTREVLRLARDPETRTALGLRAAAFVREEHSPDRVRGAWDLALERARERPVPPPRDWPPHWPRAALPPTWGRTGGDE